MISEIKRLGPQMSNLLTHAAGRKLENPIRLPQVVSSSNRLSKVDLAVTVAYFNSLNLGDTVQGHYIPGGYFMPQNHRPDAGGGKWFCLSLGVSVGAGVLALAYASARTKSPYADIDELRSIMRGKIDGQ
jgi:hypothetical protein